MRTNGEECDGIVEVDGYVRSDGTEVSAYTRDCGYDHTQDDEEVDEKVSDQQILERAFYLIAQNEGFMEGPYYDTKCIPTVGAGINISDKAIFMEIEWRTYETHQLMTKREKEELWTEIQNERPIEHCNTKPRSQEIFKSAYITSNEQYRLAKNHLKENLREFKNMAAKAGIDYDKLPPSAIVGSLDNLYNCGREVFNEKKFDLFFKALKAEDYEQAGKESHRVNMPKDRFKNIMDTFCQADCEKYHMQKYGTWY